MRWTFTILTQPVTNDQIVSLADAKADLDVNFADDDALITAHRDAAINWVSNHLNRMLGTTTLRLITDGLGSVGISLPFAPVVSVEAMRVAGTLINDFRSISGEPWVLLPAAGQSWPSYTKEPGVVEVDYTVGYAAGAAPKAAIQAVKLVTAIFYDKPSQPAAEWDAVERLLSPLRFRGIG